MIVTKEIVLKEGQVWEETHKKFVDTTIGIWYIVGVVGDVVYCCDLPNIMDTVHMHKEEVKIEQKTKIFFSLDHMKYLTQIKF